MRAFLGTLKILFDQKAVPLLRKPYGLPGTTRVDATTIANLARQAGIDAPGLARTIAAYNAAVDPAPFNPATKD